MALEAVKQVCPDNRRLSGYFVKEAHFMSPLIVGETDEDSTETIVQLRRVQSAYEKDSVWTDVNITTQSHDRWTECFRATIRMEYEDDRVTEVDGGLEQRLWKGRMNNDLSQATEVCTRALGTQSFYKCCHQAGLQYGRAFQLLDGIKWDGDDLAIAKIDVTGADHKVMSLIHPAVLDSALQVLLAQRTKGLAEPPPAFVPSRLFNAWFAASGWQSPQASTLQVFTKCSSGANVQGLEATVNIMSDKSTSLCGIERIVMAPISGKQIHNANETMMLHSVNWRPQISLMSSHELHLACRADLYAKDETAMVNFRSILESTLAQVTHKVVRELSRAELKRVPVYLKKHFEWMERYATSHADPSPSETIHGLCLEGMLEQVESLYPPWNIFPAVARELKSVLLGEQDPLQIAFSTGLAEIFYADVFSNICDSRFQALLELVTHENPNLRILEVGAGTGGMTRHILSALSGLEKQTGGTRFSEYTYTDISPSFFDSANEQFQEHKERMKFKVFNLDRSAHDQDFKEASYDLIVAGCVLHATKNLQRTIRSLRALLRPGGRLLMLEVVAPENITTNFAFGTLPGWWSSYEDFRSQYPTIEEQRWDKLLRDEGFSGNDLVLRDYKDDSCHSFSLILSTVCEETRSDAPTTNTGCVVLIIRSPSDARAVALGERIRQCLSERETRKIFLDGEQEFETHEDDIHISLLEVSTPYLSTASKSEYHAVQSIILRVRKMLWVASTSLEDVRYPEYGVMQGFLRSVRSENADKHIVTIASERESLLDLSATHTLAEQVTKVFNASFNFGSDELEYCIRDGRLLTGRLVEQAALNKTMRALVSPTLRDEPWGTGPPVKLAVGTVGFLDTLEFIDDESVQDDLGPFEIEIESRAWGLNFRDVFVALGRLPGGELGVDCAGIVRRVGARCGEITTLRPGSRVCGMVAGCMRTFPRASASSFIQIPDSLSFEVAVSFLSPGGTAYYSLIEVARLKKGEKILIHSASGSTGQMAIWIAKMVGAEIFATVGFDEKKQLLIDKFGIPADHILFSRNTTCKYIALTP